jgi:very-short-patch-repair endonuclease
MKRITEQVNAADLHKLTGKAIQRARGGVSDELAKQSAKQKREALERAFEFVLRHTLKGTGIEFTKQFSFEGSKYRYDFAIPSAKVLIEINGGQHMARSGHNSGKGVKRDATKANLAAEHNWRLITFVTDDFKKPLEISIAIMRILKPTNTTH